MSILSALACPIKVLNNIPKCSYYWFLDIIFFILWSIFWLIIFIFIFLPIKLEFSIFCLFSGKYFCPKISMNDICPTKKQFFNVIENINNAFSNKRFLLRDKGDIKKSEIKSWLGLNDD
jgi:hypothetical protein